MAPQGLQLQEAGGIERQAGAKGPARRESAVPPFAGEGVERRLVVLAPVKTAELRQEMTLVPVANHQAPLARRQPWPVKSWPQWQVCAS